MEATLEQSPLDKDVLSFVTRPGTCRGEAVITLKTEDAATRCAKHFDGRCWDVSGIPVIAKVLGGKEVKECKPVQCYAGDFLSDPFNDELADPKLDDLKLLSKYEARIDREGGWDKHNMDTFGADSCDHDDLVAQVFGNSSMLSAEAPVFVPGIMVTSIATEARKSDESTDVSTEDGDSASSCDEKDRTYEEMMERVEKEMAILLQEQVLVKWQ